MKKLYLLMLIMAALLAGCGVEETMETVSDEPISPVIATMREILVQLPEEAASPTVESDSGRLYLCDDYEITVQTLEGGDLNRTVKTLSGYEKDALTVMRTQMDQLERYEFVWASAGEQGDQIGRAVILDDGSYHYCVCVLGDAEQAEANRVFWDDMFRSVTLH